MTKQAMVNIYESGRTPLIQIHDEIVVEAKKKDVDKVSSVVSKNMQNAVKLDVPLYVNTKINTSLANFNN